jgi:pilus assembly protein Flp/PilA
VNEVDKLLKWYIALRYKVTGATAVEYGLIVALIAVVIIIAVALLGTNLSNIFDYIAKKIGALPPA